MKTRTTTLTTLVLLAICGTVRAAESTFEGKLEPFLGEPRLEIQQLFSGGRFPSIVTAVDGTVLAFWARNEPVRLRRSGDGGTTWEPEQRIGDARGSLGAASVDEKSGDILVFQAGMFRSGDSGKTWTQDEDTVIKPNASGHKAGTHGADSGITLRHGPHRGRLLQPARVIPTSNAPRDWPEHYNTALFSDDGGKSWQTSTPFPALGTGEGALAELSDGRIYYNSRRHWAPQGENARMRWTAHSDDGGQTWKDLSVSDVLPDGAQHRDYGLMAGLVRLPIRGRDILVFSNIVSPGGRRNGHVWASFDGGTTWPLKRQVDQGAFAYSSLTAGRPETPSEGWIYLLYEGGGGGRVARFNLAWLLEGEPTGDGEVPALN